MIILVLVNVTRLFCLKRAELWKFKMAESVRNCHVSSVDWSCAMMPTTSWCSPVGCFVHVLAMPKQCLWEGLSRAGNDHANSVYTTTSSE